MIKKIIQGGLGPPSSGRWGVPAPPQAGSPLPEMGCVGGGGSEAVSLLRPPHAAG